MKCLSLPSADVALDHIVLGHSSAENKYRAKKLILLRAKIWSKIDPIIKNVRTSSSFMHALKKNILLHLQR